MIDIRWWRRRLAPLVPEFLKGPVRGRLYGFGPSHSHLDVRIESQGDAFAVRIAGLPELRVPASMRGDLDFHLLTNGESIDEIANLLALALEPGGLLFDVGGHVGLLAELFCLAAPGNRAVSYEPSPVLRAKAAQLRALNGLESRITLCPSAIGDAPGRVPGYVDPGGFIGFGDAPPGLPAQEVAFTTIDAECERLGVVPTVVKIDIEGFEDRALAGAQRLLAEHRPALLLEFHLDLLEKRGVRVGTLVKVLERHGYRFFHATGRPMAGADIARSPAAVLRFMARALGGA